MPALTLGPILGVVSHHQTLLHTCCLVAPAGSAPVWLIDGVRVAFRPVTALRDGTFWHAEWTAPAPRATGRVVSYTIEAGGTAWQGLDGKGAWSFYIPADTEAPEFAYASCNGFSALKLMAATEDPYGLWKRLGQDSVPGAYLSLLIMGGDQIYADGLWEQPWMRAFAEMTDEEMAHAPVTPEIEANIDAFYEQLYLRQWGRPEVAAVLAQVPSIMMWDDHDIFDGWGSHPHRLQISPVYRRAYAAALRAFKLFQLRDDEKRMRLNPANVDFAYVLELGSETFLMLDHRTERTDTQVMSEAQWTAFQAWLKHFTKPRLFIQSAVPVVYRTFGAIERALSLTSSREELEDDLADHWSAREHQAERMRLIYTLIRQQRAARGAANVTKDEFHAKWIFLSGDVHVGCMGSVWEKAEDLGLYQVVSSGIVHPPPTPFQWLGITAASGDGNDRLGNGDLETEILPIMGARAKFLRTRNYARIHLGTDGKIWINWRCENGDRASFAV